MIDSLYGGLFQLEILCYFGGLHVLLSPQQLHGLLELVSGLNSPGMYNHISPGMYNHTSPGMYNHISPVMYYHILHGV